MDYIKKTILLTNKSKEMCMLTITKRHNGYFANFKTFAHFPSPCILGICEGDKKVIKQNVLCGKSNGYDFKINNTFDLNQTIGCMLFEDNEEKKPLAWGANSDTILYKSKIIEYISTKSSEGVVKQGVVNNVYKSVSNDTDKAKRVDEEKPSMFNKDLEVEENGLDEGLKVGGEIVEPLSEKSNQTNIKDNDNLFNMQTDKKLENVGENKLYAYGVRDVDDKAKLFESTDDEIAKIIDKQSLSVIDNFYEMVKEQLNDLFENYPNEPNLEAVVPNSKWVKVNYEGNENAYVIGLIYEMETIKYVAYGVPGKRNDDGPEDLNGYSQWIPKEVNDIDGDGYFVMFQDAVSGERVKI